MFPTDRFELATRLNNPCPDGKILIIGGGIANFTNVADTFKGIMRALRGAKTKLRENNSKIFVRRGGPNHLEGLRLMKELGSGVNTNNFFEASI